MTPTPITIGKIEFSPAVNASRMTRLRTLHLPPAIPITRCAEVLAHFQCPTCTGWWSIASVPAEPRHWWCPWCGIQMQEVEAQP